MCDSRTTTKSSFAHSVMAIALRLAVAGCAHCQQAGHGRRARIKIDVGYLPKQGKSLMTCRW